MAFVLSQVNIFRNGVFDRGELFVESGRSFYMAPGGELPGGVPVFNVSDCVVFPGFADVHVHLREPGFSYKETIRSGTLAAARGGFAAVCAMPNLDPVPDCADKLQAQLELIGRDAAVRVLPYGAISRGERGGELSDMRALAPRVAGFSDDGHGVQDSGLMRECMALAGELGAVIAAHCEDERFPPEDPRSEWRAVERDLELLRDVKCKYHVCHVSSGQSVALKRAAKADGLDVTCETAPHYLLLDDSMPGDDGRFRMNPPIRSAADRQALLDGIADGTIDMTATDHAPHSAREKAGGFAGSLNGVVGLEVAFPALYTGLVRTGAITLSRLIELMHGAPVRRFGLDMGLEKGDVTVFDLNTEYTVDPAQFLSMGRATPFEGARVYGRCKLTACRGRIAWRETDGGLR